jgi:hypothetical protein
VRSCGALIVARHARATALAIVTIVGSVIAVGLVGGSLASAADSIATAGIPSSVPALPGKCAARSIRLRLVALSPLDLVKIDAIAERYKSLGVAEVVVEKPLPFDLGVYDPARHQVAGEDIQRTARRVYAPREGELVIVLTDRDMFLRDAPWRYAFATGDRGVSVISIARMRTSFVWNADAPTATECTALLHARVYKMITRAILRNTCEADPSDDPTSARRISVLSLDDLDAIDEANY